MSDTYCIVEQRRLGDPMQLCRLTWTFAAHIHKLWILTEARMYISKSFGCISMSIYQSELPQLIPQNSVESDHGCTSSIHFDNAGDNVMLTL